MNTETTPKKKRGLLKKIAGLGGASLLVLCLAAYFVCTSAGFFKGVILPRVSQAVGATLTVEDARLSPFSSVALTGLKVQTGAPEPWLTAREIVARYSLLDIIRGKINVEEVSVNELVLHVVVNSDGTSNLDPFLKKNAGGKTSAPTPPGRPLQADVKQFIVRNGLVTFTKTGKDGGKFEVELAGLTFAAEDIKNSQTARLNLGANLKLASGAATNRTELSTALNAGLKADLGPDLIPTHVKGSFDVASLLVKDSARPWPKKPLAVGVQFDGAMAGQVLDLRQGKLLLAPTDRARNELALAGKVDLTRLSAIAGALKLSAGSLDLTPYFDMFAAPKGTNIAPVAAGTSAAALPETEPPATTLPVQNFTFDAAIGRLFLREVAISNLTATLKLDAGRVELNPVQLALNGAPANAKILLNLGVPGYEYDVNFTADQVPLAPLVNSFQPDRKGQIGGTFTALAQVQGAGVTGASLQKNLRGQFDLSSTNLNLELASVRMPVIKTILNVIIGIPDLIRHPGAMLGNLLGHHGAAAGNSGWVDEITRPPIDVICARGRAGEGRVELEQAVMQSAAFQAGASGTIALAPVLTNSALQIPVSISLGRSLAQQAGLAGHTPATEAYAKLPQFVTVKGTVGEPRPDINYLALTTVAGKAGVGILGNSGKAAFDAVEGLWAGKSAPAGQETNAPAKDSAPPKKKGLLDLFK